MSAKQILTTARDYLAKNGVNRDGSYINKSNGVQACSIGALRLAAGCVVVGNADNEHYLRMMREMPDEYYDAYHALDMTVIREYGMNKSIPQINDLSRSDDEVLALFDKAIEVTK